MKKYTFIIALLILTSCGSNNEHQYADSVNITDIQTSVNSTKNNLTSAVTCSTVSEFLNASEPSQPKDEEIIEMAKTAERYYLEHEVFESDSEGEFRNEKGEDFSAFKERVNQIFCDEMTEKYFELYYFKLNSTSWDVPTICFDMEKETMEYFVSQGDDKNDFVKLDINNPECFEDYEKILIGGIMWDNDISVEDRELLVAERTDEKITLRMTVWHQNPEFEYTEGEYCYRLENGRLVIDGIFSGRDEQYNAIVIPDEKSGTVVDVPISDDITDFYNSDSTDFCTDFLITYDSTLVLEDGKWKFDDFRIWY